MSFRELDLEEYGGVAYEYYACLLCQLLLLSSSSFVGKLSFILNNYSLSLVGQFIFTDTCCNMPRSVTIMSGFTAVKRLVTFLTFNLISI